MLKDIVDVLADPVDGSALTGADDFSRLVSETGHSYDVAKQGYVTLASGAGIAHEGDSPEMVVSREAFLSRGHFAPFVETVTERVLDALQGLPLDDVAATPTILEVGAGTGYYLTHTLDAVENSRGIGVDIAVPAAKHLAKAHPKIGAVVADVWEGLPLRDNSVDVITVIFAPRNPQEFARVLVDDGEVLILTPQAGHLDELREPLGILGVEEGKQERMLEQAAGHLVPVGEPELIEFPMNLDRESIAAQVGMSPSARHLDPEVLAERVAALPETMTVTARAQLTRMKRAPQA
ncbi:methyltransferase domain-containing protein [Corynebacterium sp. p3-SID1194]|uniref:methyltransferase domain-containing protein n=1 Tax=Corynebacterium sp. p3-SID1194 TaxID=2916105 RepID=UPI0021A4EE81|nr:methyltransferase domain-containing protein [Corynebacterium sp. p3-SID1194]MCT1450047.1 methyltransferase domain-containing protein [Corynebacterium sp. p3-SID1194]